MIGYVTVGTNNIDKAAAFYDKVLGALGAKRAWEMDRLITWASAPNTPMMAVCKPYDGQPATVGNGVMVSLMAGSPDGVKAVYDAALAAGGSDEGAPGPRGDSGFHGAYFRDLDGNKICAFCFAKA